jgi:hypothetical protein
LVFYRPPQAWITAQYPCCCALVDQHTPLSSLPLRDGLRWGLSLRRFLPNDLLSHLLGCSHTSSGCSRTSSGAYRRSHSLCALGTRVSHVDVVEVVAFPLAWCRHSTLFQCPSVLLAASLQLLPCCPITRNYFVPWYPPASTISVGCALLCCCHSQLSHLRVPSKPQCVAVASLQTGDLESVLPSTCSLRELTPRASRPLSVHF